VVAISATAWVQSAFRAGPLSASLPAITVSNPLVASVLGVTILGETITKNNAARVVLAFSVAAMVVATVALSRSQADASPQRGEKTGEKSAETTD
jgi:hypothetical protein